MPNQDRYRRRLQALIEPADVRLDGARDWDLRVHDPRFPARALAQGSLGLGEACCTGCLRHGWTNACTVRRRSPMRCAPGW